MQTPSSAASSEYQDVDIVVVSTSGDFSFLEGWTKFFRGFTIFAIHGGDPEAHATVPDGLSVELYNRRDIERRLGKHAWIFSGPAQSCVAFGILLAKKRFVYIVHEDCGIATKTRDGELINPIRQHVRNLITPSTPYYFNTMYDPYREGSDFVRGYPFSLRQGAQTAISHGLVTHDPDYDAPTRITKPQERVSRYVDAVQTVPRGCLYAMCGKNVAFDRELIGPAMFFGIGSVNSPMCHYPDMWAGWASKVVCDHLGVGVKSGLPYVRCNSTESDPLQQLEAEQKCILLQEEIIPFFQRVQLSEESITAVQCYQELARLVQEHLGGIDQYFEKMSEAMQAWLECWDEMNPSD